MQWFGLREALSVHPLDQIGDRFSGRGAVRVGNKGTKVVSWALLLFFRTLIRDFQLQHGGHPTFGACGQQRMCSRWANIFSYDAKTAAEPSHVLCGLAGGMFVYLTFLLEVFDASKGVLSRSNASRPSHVCLCSLPACAARVLRSGAVRPDAGPAFDDTVRIFFGAGAGAAAVGSDLSLNLLDMVSPSRPAPPFFGIFFNARLGPQR